MKINLKDFLQIVFIGAVILAFISIVTYRTIPEYTTFEFIINMSFADFEALVAAMVVAFILSAIYFYRNPQILPDAIKLSLLLGFSFVIGYRIHTVFYSLLFMFILILGSIFGLLMGNFDISTSLRYIHDLLILLGADLLSNGLVLSGMSFLSYLITKHLISKPK